MDAPWNLRYSRTKISFDQIANSTVIASLRETLPQIDTVILFGIAACGKTSPNAEPSMLKVDSAQ